MTQFRNALLVDCAASAVAVAAFGLAISLMASAAFAATQAPATNATAACAEMRAKVLAAEARAASDPSRLREAQYLANEGKSLCETQEQSEGTDKYRQALGVLEGSTANSTRTQAPGTT